MGAMGTEGNPGPPGPQVTPSGVGGCPEDYQRDTSAVDIILCKRGNDEMVKVGRRGGLLE